MLLINESVELYSIFKKYSSQKRFLEKKHEIVEKILYSVLLLFVPVGKEGIK